jgi:hypothetical protein
VRLFWAALVSLLAFHSSLASPAVAQICRPDCRSGYTCIDGRCVSACNPPCANHERCTAAGECAAVAATRQEPSRSRDTWLVHAGLGYGIVQIYTLRPDNIEPPGDDPFNVTPYRNLDAIAPALSAGFAFHRQRGGVVGVRLQLTLLAGSDFGDQTMLAGFLDGTVRIGPVSRSFPWLLGFGGLLGAATIRGRYPNEITPPTGRASVPYVGAKVETGFAFDQVELVADLWLGVWPGGNLSGFAVVGIRISVPL